MKPVVYTQNKCTYCEVLKVALTGQGIEFDTINIDEDKEAKEKFLETGFASTPVTKVGDDYIVGLQVNKIKEAMKK